MAQRLNQLGGGLVALAAHAKAAVNHFLEMIAARQRADVAALDRARDVALEQHHRDEADLVDVVALLPAPHSPPGDFVGDVEEVEGVGRNAAMAPLVRGDAEVAELQLLLRAHEYVERRQVAVQRLAAMQDVEHRQDPRQLASHEALVLRSPPLEPRTQVAVLGVLYGEVVARAGAVEYAEHGDLGAWLERRGPQQDRKSTRLNSSHT